MPDDLAPYTAGLIGPLRHPPGDGDSLSSTAGCYAGRMATSPGQRKPGKAASEVGMSEEESAAAGFGDGGLVAGVFSFYGLAGKRILSDAEANDLVDQILQSLEAHPDSSEVRGARKLFDAFGRATGPKGTAS